MSRATVGLQFPDVFLLQPADGTGLARYLVDRGVLTSEETLRVSAAGAGNMNCTLRVVTPRRQIIVKQARPWVEKYRHIPAPWNRTLVEAAFYEAASRDPELARAMPALLHVDRVAHVIVLEDVEEPDWTGVYAGATIDPATIRGLTAYLRALHALRITADEAVAFANPEMRELNHEHIFRFPLVRSNGLDLDAVTVGLQGAADALKRDEPFHAAVSRLGEVYLAGGARLVHGDFFPGSWLRSPRGPVVIDPEFCFLGAGEFDFGVMMAHMILAEQPSAAVDDVRRAIPPTYDAGLAMQFAGVEIMRRLIGVAQLPLRTTIERKRALLARARELVLAC